VEAGIIRKMIFTTTRAVTVFGVKVAETSVTKEFAESEGSRERVVGNGSILTIDPDFMAPMLAEAVQLSVGLTPERFSFANGQDIVVNGNIDSYLGTQYLKERFALESALEVLYGVAALTNAFDRQNSGAGGAFKNHLSDILKNNWEEQPAK